VTEDGTARTCAHGRFNDELGGCDVDGENLIVAASFCRCLAGSGLVNRRLIAGLDSQNKAD
jgi:hypothetical protein